MKRILSVLMVLLLAGSLFGQPGQEQKDAVTLKLYMPPPSSDMSHKDSVLAAVNKMLMPKIGATIDISFVDWGNYQTKINVMLAANEPFDFFASVGFTEFTANIAKGILFPMDDLLQRYGKTILALTPAELWPAVTYQGKKYAIINVYPYAQWKGADFSEALVQKYGFDYLKVKTLKDIEPFLAKVKAGEPDIVPVVGGETLMPWAQSRLDKIVSGGKGYNPAGIAYDAVSGRLVSTYDMPEFRQTLQTLQEWYRKGYIAKDAALRNKDLVAEVSTKKYACWGANVAVNGPSVKESNAYGLPTVSVRSSLSMVRTNVVNGVTSYISKTSRNKEKTMQFLDLLWSDKKIFNTLCYGVEGQDYDVVSGAGTDLPTVQTRDPMKWALWHPWIAEMMVNQWPSNWNDAVALAEFREDNAHAPRSPILGFVFDPTAVKDQVAQIAALIGDMELIETTGSFSGTVDEYIIDMKAKLAKLGYDEVFAEVQRQLSDWQKANSGK